MDRRQRFKTSQRSWVKNFRVHDQWSAEGWICFGSESRSWQEEVLVRAIAPKGTDRVGTCFISQIVSRFIERSKNVVIMIAIFEYSLYSTLVDVLDVFLVILVLTLQINC